MTYKEQIRATLERCSGLDPGDLRRYQDRLLERLCRHAAQRSDWYGNYLPAMFADADPAGGEWMREKWSEIPIVERKDMVEQPEHYHCVEDSPFSADIGETSGSTGRQLRYRKSALGNLASSGTAERAFNKYDFDFSGIFADIRVLVPTNRRFPKVRRWNSLPNAGEQKVFEIRKPVEEQWAWLKEVKPDYIMTYPSNLRSLGRVARADPGAVRLKACVASAEPLFDEVREDVRSVFGAETYSLYGLRELGHVATSCNVSDQLHVGADVTLVEIIRDDGSDAKPGETGQIVATSLYNYAMPFIRYRTGDYAEVGEPCECGWHLPTLRRVFGRRRNRFLLADGRQVWPGHMNLDLERRTNVIDFRLEQISTEHMRFHYVRGGCDADLDSRSLSELMTSLLDCSVQITAIRADSIKPSGYAKQERFISRIV